MKYLVIDAIFKIYFLCIAKFYMRIMSHLDLNIYGVDRERFLHDNQKEQTNIRFKSQYMGMGL